MECLQATVKEFRSVWFPNWNETQPFWFRARHPKYRATIESLCNQFLDPVLNLTSSGEAPEKLAEQLRSSGWDEETEIGVLAVMLDQMPRNGLALERIETIDDSFSLKFCESLKTDNFRGEFIRCFISLVFRHSNKLKRAKDILLRGRTVGQLGSLEKRFYIETEKREAQLGGEVPIR
jgi:uncharacterized protein (DUF924 family)